MSRRTGRPGRRAAYEDVLEAKEDEPLSGTAARGRGGRAVEEDALSRRGGWLPDPDAKEDGPSRPRKTAAKEVGPSRLRRTGR